MNKEFRSRTSNYVAEFTGAWAACDPAAAGQWLDALPEGELRAVAAANLADTWGRHDLVSASAWATQLPAGATRDRAEKVLAELSDAGDENRPGTLE
jgi:hypothetical protein